MKKITQQDFEKITNEIVEEYIQIRNNDKLKDAVKITDLQKQISDHVSLFISDTPERLDLSKRVILTMVKYELDFLKFYIY